MNDIDLLMARIEEINAKDVDEVTAKDVDDMIKHIRQRRASLLSGNKPSRAKQSLADLMGMMPTPKPASGGFKFTRKL